jgi:hypothetical protein
MMGDTTCEYQVKNFRTGTVSVEAGEWIKVRRPGLVDTAKLVLRDDEYLDARQLA